MAITPALFAIFSGFIRDRLGLSYGPNEAELLENKLAMRAADAGFASLLDYYYYLRYDDASGAELSNLADALVVGESYLFREVEQLEMALRRFIAPAVAAGRRPRIWSAACAGGEEPFTIAILLAHQDLLGRVEIVASDLSRRALSRARRRVYSRRALRGAVDPALLARHVEVDENEVRVSESIAAAVTWRQVNLVDDAAIAELGRFDVIFCRNVLIYFDDAVVTRVVGRLTTALVPGGALFVGISESLLRFATALVCEEHDGVFVYRQKVARER